MLSSGFHRQGLAQAVPSSRLIQRCPRLQPAVCSAPPRDVSSSAATFISLPATERDSLWDSETSCPWPLPSRAAGAHSSPRTQGLAGVVQAAQRLWTTGEVGHVTLWQTCSGTAAALLPSLSMPAL